ncbi:MAG: D-alanine--D-alanine ligase, partial [Planctomycetota bacterium]
ELEPDIAFNLLVDFDGVAIYDQHVVGYLELLRKRYTGCNPRGMMLARDKGLSKEILGYHRIRSPGFAVFPVGKKVQKPAKLAYPLVVKSLNEEASLGISQASLVTSDEKLKERVEFMHQTFEVDVIAEEYVEGREISLALLGNGEPRAFPAWELDLSRLPKRAPRFATARVKWDLAYQRRHAIRSRPAQLPPPLAGRLARLGRRAYALLGLSGYARIDVRLREDGTPFVLEANPNPDLSRADDFARGAAAAGLGYEDLVERILRLGIAYHRAWYL